MEKLKNLISTYENYPKTGVNFKDVLEIVHHPEIFRELIIKMSSSELIKNAEALISIDARGFVFGSAIALQTSKPMIVARKPGKLPGEVIKKNYNLEYGENVLTVQKNSIKKFNSFAIIDDFDSHISNVLGFLNLDWDENIKNYRDTALNRGKINTPSSSQVIQPLYKTSIEKWRNYEKFFEDSHIYLDKWVNNLRR